MAKRIARLAGGGLAGAVTCSITAKDPRPLGRLLLVAAPFLTYANHPIGVPSSSWETKANAWVALAPLMAALIMVVDNHHETNRKPRKGA